MVEARFRRWLTVSIRASTCADAEMSSEMPAGMPKFE